MTKLPAILVSLAAVVLTACASAEESSAPAPEVRPTSGPIASSSDAGLDAIKCPNGPVGPTRTPGPVERCSGGYNNEVPDHSVTQEYLHSDGTLCLLGTNTVLHADGRASRVYSTDTGTWKGDELYFEVTFGNSTIHYSPFAGCTK